jgi:peptide-methionine (R)-S-oxide reductase
MNGFYTIQTIVLIRVLCAKSPAMKMLFTSVIILWLHSCSFTQNRDDMQSKTSARNNDTGVYPITRTDEEWKQQLDPVQYKVLREAATERPFTGIYYKNMDAGIYYSAASGQPLFISDSKYDSGCGWPSFFEPITEGAILYRKDNTHGMIRTEIVDSSSGSHLGHVFDDGPAPTGLRYCMNSVSMVFVGVNEEPPALVKEYMKKHASAEEKKAVEDFIQSNR